MAAVRAVAVAVAVAVVEKAASLNPPLIPEFWQRLLAAEMSPMKAEAVLSSLGQISVEGLLSHVLLTDSERHRARTADTSRFSHMQDANLRILFGDLLPEPVQAIPAPPPAIYAWGDVSALTLPTVAIVGTRNASTYGKACAQKFAEAMARAGVVIVSGGALGIDAAAHKGALAVDGRTVAVLATGVDDVYPAVHSGLFSQIRQRGCLVSQFALGSRVNDYKFLMRNGLISALSLAILVVEAPERSGALSTAQAAAEMGRDVFVVPAGIDHRGFGGSFALIRDGATLVNHPDQILEALGIDPTAHEVHEPIKPDTLGAKILSILSTDPKATEAIVSLVNQEASDVLSELTMLELDGRVIRDGIGYAIKP